MAANTSIQLAELDFNDIKNNLKQFLRSQNTFKDYNFEGSGLSVLLDVLAYNTQYNAFYLNMVANEMFLDTALQRPSVVSHAKLLNYTPKSAIAPTATINVAFTNLTGPTFTLPAYTNFLSESINGINYNFLTTDSKISDVVTNSASFENIQIKQGILVNYNYIVDSTNNPSYTFELPDSSIDTSTLKVLVQESSSNTLYEIYTLADNYLLLDGTSKVYFLQEALNGNYEVLFGDGIIGKKPKDGNIVKFTYITTQGTAGQGANNFVLMDSISGMTSNTTILVSGLTPASQGYEKENLDSIKFQATKSYSAQKRAVTKEDYITLIKQNNNGYNFDAVNVWSGEENVPAVYGKVFICLKPSGSYTLTPTQKQRIIEDIIKPISVLTVEPVITDPDYNYLQIFVDVYYDIKRTNLSSGELNTLVRNTINNFATTNLNTFNSTYVVNDLLNSIINTNPSIITADVSTKIQKKFYPTLTVPNTYILNFDVPLKKGMLTSGITSYPAMSFVDPINPLNVISGVYIEEIPSTAEGIESVSVINPGFSYQLTPTVTIIGDGSGATAEATLDAKGRINKITVTNKGTGYTSASVVITAQSNDSTGQAGAAIANLEGRYGTLRTYYFNSNNMKTTLNSNIGTVDYEAGSITLNSFNPLTINNELGQLGIIATPDTPMISSTFNKILTVDPFDPTAITVTITAKK